MAASGKHGGRREGAGRPRGSLNKRTLDVLQEVAEQWPDWSPLKQLAAVANDAALDIETRIDAAKAAAPYCHAKLKPVTADVDGLVELEARIARARLEAQADAIDQRPGLAERLERVRIREATLFLAQPAVIDAEARHPDAKPSPIPSPQAQPAARESRRPVNPTPEASYRPILPFPQEQVMLDTNYDVLKGPEDDYR